MRHLRLGLDARQTLVAAAVEWQESYGIFADGVVRASTWRAMLRAFKPVA
jgi:hypothetical protein